MIPTLFEFFDVGFLRLIWALIVEYLIATGFLTPEQHDQWINGIGHIISVSGSVIFLAIWQYHSHKKQMIKETSVTVTTTEPNGPITPVVDQATKPLPSQYIPSSQTDIQ